MRCESLVLATRVVGVIQNLDFDPSRERDSHGRNSISPKKQACVATLFHMPPLEFHNAILEHSLGS